MGARRARRQGLGERGGRGSNERSDEEARERGGGGSGELSDEDDGEHGGERSS